VRILTVAVLALLVGCTSGGQQPETRPDELVVITHDSFAMSQKVLQRYTERTGQEVTIVPSGDAGQMVNAAILSAGTPAGDVLFGVDNTFLSRLRESGAIEDYESPRTPEDVREQAGVTPVDTGAVCLNYDREFFADKRPPQEPAELVEPRYRGLSVVQNPATSSPGLAFLLSTISRQSDWQGYWKALKDNGVKVVDGWENAYYQQFSGGSGEGDRPIVVSYSTSPAAEVMFAEDPSAPAPTANVDADCFRQVEYAAVLAGARNPQGARQFIDFMLSPAFQDQVGEQMFVYPVLESASVPEEFDLYAEKPRDPVDLAPEQIAAGRDGWIEQWSAIMEQ
jgi:thiamine transport system substrate-binding protein